MLIGPEQEALIGRVFESYLMEYHHGDILQLIIDPKEETHHAVVINAMTLFETNMEVGDYFNAYPDDVLAIFDKVLNKIAMELSDTASSSGDAAHQIQEQTKRFALHARITGLPVCPELTRVTIPRSRDVGHFLSVTGTVIRTSIAKVLEYERDYMCSKCRHVFMVKANFDQYYTFVPPTGCPNPDGCHSSKFLCLSGGSGPAACRDYQEIKIQEQVQRLSVGSIPRSLVVLLEDDLVDSCKSGDDVTVYGVMCLRWKPLYNASRCDMELVLKANNIEVNNQQAAATLLSNDIQKEFEDYWNSYKHDPIAGRNRILLSLCPQAFGMYVIKLAVAMVLAGGVQRTDSSGTKIRGECHMLLVGDPGTGKSQLLKYAAKIMPRSVLTAGIGSTSAGLTVAAVKDGGDWHLEAGALVLADGGLCCIDEFNSIKEHDRISIHEAMEQQSISVAKAGMVCKLNTRTTILAATNPKGQYDSSEPLSVNVALASPLLSRFDLVLVLLDTRNPEWDRIISSYILEDGGTPTSSSLWSMEKMKAYFSVIRTLQPQVSEAANRILAQYYQLQRRSDYRNAARTTVRMLESLGRLAEAHARLMYRQTVTTEDAVMAISVMECSMQGGGLLGNVNGLLTSFPADPDQQYYSQCQLLLEGLNLPRILQTEMDRLASLKSNFLKTLQCSSLVGNNQHHLRGPDSETPSHNLTSKSKSNNISSLSLPDVMTLPLITLTQEQPHRKPSHSLSPMSVRKVTYFQTLNDTSNTLETISSESEPAHKRGKNKKKVSQTQVEMLPSTSERDPESMVDERLTELNCLQGGEEMKEGQREKVLSGKGTGQDVPDSSNTPSDFHNSSTLSLKEERNLSGIRIISTVLREKTVVETERSSDLHAKLSAFMFTPRKTGHSAHEQDSKTTPETHTGTVKQKQVSHNDSDNPLANTGKNKLNQIQNPLGDSHLESEKEQSVTVQKVDNSMTLRNNVGSKMRSNDNPSLCLERTKISRGDESKIKNQTFMPPLQSASNPALHRSGQIQTIEAKHTGATVSDPKNSPYRPFSTECLRRETSQCPLGKKQRTAVQSNSQEQEPLQVTSPQTMSTFKAKPMYATDYGTAVKVVADDLETDQSSPKVRKRKCSVLGPSVYNNAASGDLLSGLSLFASTSLNDDVFDTDWDQDV